jgi:hypothetical protein
MPWMAILGYFGAVLTLSVYSMQLTSKRLFKDIDRLQQNATNALEPGGKAPGRALGARG